VCPDQVHPARDDEGEDLLARPQGAGLEDAGVGHVAVPAGQEHEDVHHLALKQNNTGHRNNSAIPTLTDNNLVNHSGLIQPSIYRFTDLFWCN